VIWFGIAACIVFGWAVLTLGLLYCIHQVAQLNQRIQPRSRHRHEP
jgi:hypothetical protein